MASRNSLSEDWEDVGDDNFSVISFPASTSEADAALDTSQSSDKEAGSPQPRTAPVQIVSQRQCVSFTDAWAIY